MSVRVQVILDEEEKARFRRRAEAEGLSLSAWLRRAGREMLAAAEARSRIETVEDLHAFFEECDAREQGQEPDWEEHRRVIRDSRSRGLPSD